MSFVHFAFVSRPGPSAVYDSERTFLFAIGTAYMSVGAKVP
jgi:hypothetical protein